MPHDSQYSLLMVGNFLSESLGTRGICEDLAVRLANAGWPVLTTSSHRGRLARLFDMMQTSWNQRKYYDVALVDVYSGPAFFWAEAVCWVLRTTRKPYILTLHGGNLPNFARRWSSRVHRQLRSAAAVTTPSRYLLEQMRPYRQDLCLLPNPLEVSLYPFRPRKTALPKLVWLRAFHEIYNPALGPKVLASLAVDFPDINLTMYGPDKGDGSLEDVRQIAEALGVAEHLALPGNVAKHSVPLSLDRGDIFLNTTNIDNTPVSVLEAMACGMCVVSTNVGGIPYMLEHEHDSLLVPPDDPEQMACAVRRILTEPELAHRLSCNARRKVENFDWSTMLPQWERLLTSVAEGTDTSVNLPILT